MKLLIKKGATSVLALIFIQDSSSTTGAGLSGLVFNTSGLVCYRGRADDGNAGGTAITLATATLGTWATGGFVEKDATHMKGVYEIGITNASLATGSDYCVLYFSGATNMAPCVLEIQLVAFDPDDAVHLGLSSLPNTAVTTNASLLTSGTGTDQLSVASGIAQANVEQWDSVAIAEPATDGIPDVNIKNMNNVAATSITTINANQGTTQPVNFTGAAGSALVKVDVTDIATAAVTVDGNGLLSVNLVDVNGAAVIETGLTVLQALRLIASTTGAKLSGAGTGTEVFRNAVADSANRVTATVDSSGNRTAITYNL